MLALNVAENISQNINLAFKRASYYFGGSIVSVNIT